MDEVPLPGVNGHAFVLAHLSDPHVPHRLLTWPTALLNKRIFGFLTWQFRRVHLHRREVLDALSRDLAAVGADHVAVTGDVVNIALPQEFRAAAGWLHTLGSPDRVTVVPGNHDAYVAVSWQRSWRAWQAFMTSDDGAGAVVPEAGRREQPRRAGLGRFPIYRRRGPVALIGLSTALPTAPGRSSGCIGPAQLDRLAAHLREAAAAGLFRVVLLHHPPHAPQLARYKQLSDDEAFRSVIAAEGAELVLHGHEHRFRYEQLAGPVGMVPCFGVPSASMLPPNDEPIQAGAYHLHHIRRRGDTWSIEIRIRTYEPAQGCFVESGRRSLSLPVQAPAGTVTGAARSSSIQGVDAVQGVDAAGG